MLACLLDMCTALGGGVLGKLSPGFSLACMLTLLYHVWHTVCWPDTEGLTADGTYFKNYIQLFTSMYIGVQAMACCARLYVQCNTQGLPVPLFQTRLQHQWPHSGSRLALPHARRFSVVVHF